METVTSIHPALLRHDWPLPRADRGVLMVHGLGEHGGRYAALARWFRERGYAVRAFDHWGHGRSPGARGALPHADALSLHLAGEYADFTQTLGRAPLLVAHSLGGLIAASAVARGEIAPPALVLSSPALRSWAPRWQIRLAGLLAPRLPDLSLSNGLARRYLSHDAAVVQAYRDDPLVHSRVTPRLADWIFRSGEAVIARASEWTTPTLLMFAGADRLVVPQGSRDFLARAPACVQGREFPGLYHEIFNESEELRAEVLECLELWLAGLRH